MLNRIVFFLCAILFFTACNNDSSSNHEPSPAGQNPPAVPQETTPQIAFKPLPPSCDENLAYSVQWPLDKNAFNYTVTLSYKENGDGQTITLDGLSTQIDLQLDRNVKHFIRIEKTTMTQSYSSSQWMIEVPSCQKRADWKAAHPEYEEPAAISVQWN